RRRRQGPPRVVVVACSMHKTVGEVLDEHPEIQLSRIPIYDGELDRATGFVLRSDILLAAAKNEDDKKMDDFRRDLMTLRAAESASVAFEALLNDRQHIALVRDQYGSVVGLVTLEDVIETLIGLEIVDEQDQQVDMQAFARQRWKQRATQVGLKIEDVRE
ncbi:MAG: CBS domain-containing protein, partial [Planctomycetota bacterium]